MDLSEENKKYIDKLSYYGLLERWRNSPAGDPWFQGETGKYWGERMRAMRDSGTVDHVATSKQIGWDG